LPLLPLNLKYVSVLNDPNVYVLRLKCKFPVVLYQNCVQKVDAGYDGEISFALRPITGLDGEVAFI